MRKVKIFLLNLVWVFYLTKQSLRWKRSTHSVAKTQKKYLLELLRKNSETAFGRQHKFSSIDSISSFQKHVGLRTYDDFSCYIEKIEKETVSGILTVESVQSFGISSGSTKASKLLPYTGALIKEFQHGIIPWLWYLFRNNPNIMSGKSYWSVTPVAQTKRYSLSGIPIGFEDEGMYFDTFSRWIMNKVLLIPSEVSHIKDMRSFRYITLLFLLQEKSLSWVSIWNPTFILLCLEPLHIELPRLIEDIRNGTVSDTICLDMEIREKVLLKLQKNVRRARELELLCSVWHGREYNDRIDSRTFYERVWPNLRLISCWADGEAKEVLKKLYDYFPRIVIQPKGLIATEGFISFPFSGELSALSLNSHFFEFEEIDRPLSIKLAHELQNGHRYCVIITTGAGLYRYQLNDVIEVKGFVGQCPLIRFVGKKDKVVDLYGEKLNEDFVRETVSQILADATIFPSYWMLAPEQIKKSAVSYTLFIQADISNENISVLNQLADKLDKGLKQNYHYEYCRKLNQLGCCKIFLINPVVKPEQVYLKTCSELGQRLGDIKMSKVHSYKYWSKRFGGEFVS